MSLAALVFTALVAADAVTLQVQPVPLDATDPSRERVGCLSFRGGLEIRSADERVGGLSGLELTADGRLLAVSDQGHWLTARPVLAAGRLVGLEATTLGPLTGLDGLPLPSKREQDAESLARLPDGRQLMGFERWHRVWTWPEGGHPTPFGFPPDLADAPTNSGPEGLAVLSDGDVVIVSEDLRVDNGIRGWRGHDGAWQAFALGADDLVRPSGAATLPSGDVLLLERGYSAARGSVIRLRRLPAAELREGRLVRGVLLAELEAPLTVDNFEGVAVDQGASGETLVYLISDDNFSESQRTLLMLFVLDEATCPGGASREEGSDGRH